MAISYISSSSADGSGTALSATAPATILTGDVLVALVHLNNGVARTATDNNGSTPFTDSGMGLLDYNGNSARYYIFYRVAGGSEPASYAWTASTSDRWCLAIGCYRGVNTASVFDVAPSGSTENEGTDASASPFADTNALTTLSNGAMMIAFGMVDNAAFTFTATPGDSFNSRVNEAGQQLTGMADKLIPTIATQGSVSWTATGGACATQVFSLKAATEAGLASLPLMGIGM